MEINPVNRITQNQQPDANAQVDLPDFQEYIQLMVTQLQYQDPTDPVDNKEFLSQMASFSQLQMLSALSQSMQKSQQESELANATLLIDKKVEIQTVNGSSIGTVQSVNIVNGKPLLEVKLESGEILTNISTKELLKIS